MPTAGGKETDDKERRLPIHSPSHPHFIAYSVACRKPWIVSYNRQPRPETSRDLWTWEERHASVVSEGWVA
jgi:hypothetical protein